jgi:hypothetical protein
MLGMPLLLTKLLYDANEILAAVKIGYAFSHYLGSAIATPTLAPSTELAAYLSKPRIELIEDHNELSKTWIIFR